MTVLGIACDDDDDDENAKGITQFDDDQHNY